MSAHEDEPRIWARLDRSVAAPRQRALSHQMRAQPTEAERKLWWHLRHRLKTTDTHFRRQVRIGPYIADFASHRLKLIIEVDGGQHAEQASADLERMRVLESHGYRVLRFWNNDVLSNIDGVLERVRLVLATPTPTPIPSPQGRGEEQDSDAEPSRQAP